MLKINKTYTYEYGHHSCHKDDLDLIWGLGRGSLMEVQDYDDAC